MTINNDTRIILGYTVRLTDDVFEVLNTEWHESYGTFSYDGVYLIDDATGNAFKISDPWTKLAEMIDNIDENGLPVYDFGCKDWEDCEACADAMSYNVNGRCFNHEEN